MSGIPKSERDPTRVTHYDKAVKFRKTIIEYLEQDFGTDKAYLSDGTVNHRYWLIKKIRENIYDLTHDMLVCITAANSIHIYHIYEYNERRRYFTQAISDCESILQELNLVIDYLKIKPSKYEEVTEQVKELIKSIKSKRQGDNPIRTQILERDAKEKLKIEEKIRAGSICC